MLLLCNLGANYPFAAFTKRPKNPINQYIIHDIPTRHPGNAE